MTTAATDAAVDTKPAGAPASAPAATSAPAAGSAPAAVSSVSAAGAATAAPVATTRLLGEGEPKPAAVSAGTPAATGPTPVALKPVDGSALTADDVKAITTFATENGLTQAQAEKVMAREEAGRVAAVQARTAETTAISDRWLAETKAHPEIGGAKLDATVAEAKRAMTALLPADVRARIANSPYANNPDLLLLLRNASRLLPVEDTIYAGTSVVQTQAENPASVLYPSFAKR